MAVAVVLLVPLAGSSWGTRRGAEAAGAGLERAATATASVRAGSVPGGRDVSPAWKQIADGHVWSFPGDHWPHRGYRTEWWYLTGHLETDTPPRRRFAYQFTLFRVGLLPEPPGLDSRWSAAGLIMGHAALTDVEAGTHRFSELLYRQTPFLGGFGRHPAGPIAWSRGPAGTDGTWELSWNGEAFDLRARDDRQGFAFSLQTRPLKPLVLHGAGGVSRKGAAAGAASWYYSFTRLATEGELHVDGRVLRVRGMSWMDQEFSSSHLGSAQIGWDWFSLQLDDGRDLMLYLLRDRRGAVDHAQATLVSVDGGAVALKAGEWDLQVLEQWRSEATGATYPAAWRITVPGGAIDVRAEPVLANQENRSALTGGLFYWEGAVVLRRDDGRPAGRGFVELTGYGENNRPPL